MKRRRRRKAATYIIVIFMASVIVVTGTAVLSIVTQDIKSRVNESKQIQNLYGSDSNLDLVYSIIQKNSDVAVGYANSRAYEKYKNDESINYSELNYNFKKDFLYFLGTVSDSDNKKNNPLYYGIENRKYMVYNKNDGDTEEQDRLKRTDKSNYAMSDVSFKNKGTEKQSNQIKIIKYDVDMKNLKITIQVQSTFETKDSPVSKLSNEKTITTKYILKAPDYADDINRSDKKAKVNLYQVQKGLYVDENLKVDNSNLTVDGTTWVKGKDSSLSNDSYFAYDKYKDGIEVNNGQINTIGNLSTNKTINLKTSADVTNSQGNVYAENVYLGPGKKVTLAEGDNYTDNKMHIQNDLVSNNDLTVDAKKSIVSIDNDYYGISDKTEKSDKDKFSAAKNSSSIIINTNDNSEVNINKNAYLCGLAYIDFNADKSYYKTGESIAVIGNYEAYTKKVESEIGKDDSISFSKHKGTDDNMLELIEFANDAEDTDLKANHFIEYYKDSDNTIKDGGIKVGQKVFSTGASVYKNSIGDILKNKSSIDDKKTMMNAVNTKKLDYGVNVFNLGFDGGESNIYDKVINDSATKNGISEYVKTVDSQIDFDKLPKDNSFVNINSDNTINQKYGYSILDGDDKKKESNVLVLEDGILKSLNSSGETDLMDLKSSDPKYEGKVKAIIITKGDLVIKGDTDIYGCVIVGGNLYIEDNAKVSVNFDQNVIENIMAHNSSLYDSIFKSDAYKIESDKEITIGEKDDISYAEDGWYDADTYLKKGLWKLKTPNVDSKKF